MKRILQSGLIIIMLFLTGGYTFSQSNPNAKALGQIPIPAQVTPASPVSAIPLSNSGNGPATGLVVPLDGTFTMVSFLLDPQTNPPGVHTDDGTTELIPLPFTFCFYGTPQTGFYINNNGNVSFGGGYTEFTSTGFPVTGYPMLAAFWADVDTRPANGEVYYKMDAHRVVVIWNNVGYFANHNDKTNTFELIFTDGTDPLIGVGNNVAFSYGNMTWTTGDASFGVDGFGGIPATVGVNKGDGVKYALVGRFDHAGTDYDGAGGAYDGVGFLTDKYFAFDACTETVIIPGNIPTLTEWGLIILGLALLGFGTFYIVRMKG